MEEKQYFIRIKNKKVPVSKSVFKECARMSRRERYQRVRDRDKRLAYYDAWDAEGTNGAELCADQEFSTEEKALAAIEAEKIWQCVEMLKDEYQVETAEDGREALHFLPYISEGVFLPF